MDLNELLHAHQIAVMRASAAGDDGGGGGGSHFDKIALYAEQIRALRDRRQAGPPPPLPASATTIIYGTYAGDPAPDPTSASLDSWESEGGALDPPHTALPPGITSQATRRYFVGPYEYSDIALAKAEFARQNLSRGLLR